MNRYFLLIISAFITLHMVGCATPETNKTKNVIRNSAYNKLYAIGVLIENNQLDKAETDLEELLNKGLPTGPLNDMEKASAYTNLAYIYYQHSEYKKAIVAYEDVLSLPLEPGSQNRNYALTNLSLLYVLEEQIDQAERLASQSIAEVNDPSDLIHWTLANYFLKHGNREKAEYYFKQALQSYSLVTNNRRGTYLIPRQAYSHLAQLYHSDPTQLNAALSDFAAIRPDISHLNLYVAFNKDSVKKPDGESNADSNSSKEAEDAYLPIIKVAPAYPSAAQRAGVTGYCVVEYTVMKTGAVSDVKTVACEPAGYFEEPSILAAKKFKYKPKVIDGKVMEVEGVNNLFTYELY